MRFVAQVVVPRERNLGPFVSRFLRFRVIPLGRLRRRSPHVATKALKVASRPLISAKPKKKLSSGQSSGIPPPSRQARRGNLSERARRDDRIPARVSRAAARRGGTQVFGEEFYFFVDVHGP